jgi:lantibiotic biosynthesis protein
VGCLRTIPERRFHGGGSVAGRVTELDGASVGTGWRPILSGTSAQQALQAVESIASAAPLPGERDPSLFGGRAGLALLYTWLARTRRLPGADVLAWQYLDEAIDAVATQTMDASLYGGFPGVAWAAELVDGLLDPDAEDRNEAVDDSLLRLLSQAHPWPAPHDLVVAVTGLGVYALQRCPRPTAIECLHLVVDRLEEHARRDEHGIYWWTPPAGILHQDSREQYPSGRADLGLAHGAAGAIALLGSICSMPSESETAGSLLQGAVSWLLAQAVPTAAGPTFPVWLAPGVQPSPARCAWCYGDPGIAAALLLAARGLGSAEWEHTAVTLACRAAERPPEETGVRDAGFCHGTAGLAHIYNRMYQATGNETLGRAAVYWLERTLDFYRRARASGDSWVQGSRDGAEGGPWTGTGLLGGAAGVALVLLAATTPVEPLWDRMFLVSDPAAPLRRTA